MITILVVGPGAGTLATFGAAHPSVEIVTASGAEDALERLARNRRIDAVLLLDDGDAEAAAALIREEDPGAPPVYCASAGPGVRTIGPGAPREMLERAIRDLSKGA